MVITKNYARARDLRESGMLKTNGAKYEVDDKVLYFQAENQWGAPCCVTRIITKHTCEIKLPSGRRLLTHNDRLLSFVAQKARVV
jgi:hypothetical protein